VDLGEFEVRIHLGGHLDDLTFPTELIDEFTLVTMHFKIPSNDSMFLCLGIVDED